MVALGGPVSSWPRGQAELFDPGALMLMESLRLGRRALFPVEASAGATAVVALLAGVFPLGALLAGLGREGKLSASFLAGRAAAHAGTLALLFGAASLLQAATGALLSALGGRLIGSLHLDAPAEDLAFAGLFTVALGVVAALGVLRDLASVAAVRGGHGFYVASSRALACARKGFGWAFLDWAWRASLGVAGVALAAWLTPAGVSAAAVAAGVALHQAAILGATFARASWLAAAMRRYDATEPALEG